VSRGGSDLGGLLRGLHTDKCRKRNTGRTCYPVVLDDPDGPGDRIEVVIIEWCNICGAADWEVV